MRLSFGWDTHFFQRIFPPRRDGDLAADADIVILIKIVLIDMKPLPIQILQRLAAGVTQDIMAAVRKL